MAVTAKWIAKRRISGCCAHPVKGVSRTLVHLAYMNAEGLDVPKNTSAAISLYERAASKGELLAVIALTRIYAKGDGADGDLIVAKYWCAALIERSKGQDGFEREIAEAREFLSK